MAPPDEFCDVTLLLTDLVASSLLWQRDDEGSELIERHRTVTARVLRDHGGEIITDAGDGMCAVYTTVESALGAAVAVQMETAAIRADEFDVRMRVAIHHGRAELRPEIVTGRSTFTGWARNELARLCAAGHGGQILVSGAAVEHLQTPMDVAQGRVAGVQLRNLGLHRLRDVPNPIEIHEVVDVSLPGNHPPLATQTVEWSRLPIPPTSFVGRNRELGAVTSAVLHHGIVTLVGPPGVGKSRLALETAAGLAGHFSDGVTFCELSRVEAGGVPRAIADALGVSEPPEAEASVAATANWLVGRRALLILDNCEHLIDEVARAARHIAGRAGLIRILATSREALGVTGEHVEQLAPLPTTSGPGSVPPAVHLFVDRAESNRLLSGDDADKRQDIDAICKLLDGIPLAIELAAAAAKVLPLAEVMDRLERDVSLPAVRRGDAEHHRSLQAAITWSYDRMSSPEQSLLRRLPVFAGGFNHAGVVALAGPSGGEALDGLLQRSLVEVDRARRRSARFRLLEPIRAYALQRAAEGEIVEARRALAAHYARLAAESIAGVRGPAEVTWVRTLDEEFANLEATVASMLADGRTGAALQLVCSLWDYAFMRLRYSYFDWVDRTITSAEASTEGYAEALGIAALGAWARGNLRAAKRLGRRAVEVEEAHGAPSTIPARLALVNVAAYEGDEQLATSHFSEVVAWSRRHDDTYWMVNSLVLSCLSFALRGDQETAVRLGRRALDMADELGNPSTVAWAEFGLGSALHVSGDLASAEAHLGASLHRARSVGNQWVLGLGLGQFASVRRLTAGPRDALPSMVESLELWGRAGNRVQLGHDLRLAALCAGSAGETATCLRVEAAAQAVGASLPLLARESAELVELLAAAERIHPDLPRDRLAIEARAAGWKAATSAAIAELRKVVSGEIVADDDAARAPRP